MPMKDAVVAFLAGSSVVTFFFTMLHTGVTASFQRRNEETDTKTTSTTALFSVLYGATTVLIKRWILDTDASDEWALPVGAVLGWIVSFLSDSSYWSKCATQRVDHDEEERWKSHAASAGLFALLFRVYVLPVTAWCSSD